MKFSSLLLASLLLAGSLSAAPVEGTKVGIQTWTLRNMKFEQVVDFCVAHKIKYVQLIPGQVDPFGPIEKAREYKAVLDSKGLVCYTFGVVSTSLDKEQNRKIFEFAKAMGCHVVVVEPNDFKIFDNLEELAKEYDIKVAIHNHGIKSLYGNPEVVKNLIKHRDSRIGICLDAGHVTGAGFDAAKIFREYNGRVYDIHLKDKSIKKAAEGEDVILDVKIGTGNTNFKGLFDELKKSKWNGVLAIETDNGQFASNPAEYVDEALNYARQSFPE